MRVSVLVCALALAAAARLRVHTPWPVHCNEELLQTAEYFGAYRSAETFWRFALGATVPLDDVASRAIAMRIMAPRLAVHASLAPTNAPQCRVFAAVHAADPQFTCDAGELARQLTHQVSRAIEQPYGHTRVVNGGGPAVIIYGVVRSKKLADFVGALERSGARCVLIFRHLQACVTQNTIALDRFAATDMELLALANGAHKANGPYGSFVLSDEVPEHTTHMGPQAISAIVKAAQPLETLSFVAENAPLISNHIAKLKIDHKIVTDNKNLHDAYVATIGDHNVAYSLHHGDVSVPSRVSINDSEVEIHGISLPKMLEFAAIYSGLVAETGLNVRAAKAIMMTRHTVPHPQLDLSDCTGLVILNDLETDQAYASWPRSLAVLQAPPSMPPFFVVARNLARITLLWDATRSNAASNALLMGVLSMMDQRYPMQFAVLAVDPSDCPNDKVSFAHVLSGAANTAGRCVAAHLLRNQNVTHSPHMSHEEAKALLADAAAACNVPAPDFDAVIQDQSHVKTLRCVKNLGLMSHIPAILYNNRLLMPSEMGNWQRTIATLYAEDTGTLQLQYNAGTIDDSYAKQLDKNDSALLLKYRHPIFFSSNPAVDRDFWSVPRKWIGNATAKVSAVIYAVPSRDDDFVAQWLFYVAEALPNSKADCAVRVSLHPVILGECKSNDVRYIQIATGSANEDADNALKILQQTSADHVSGQVQHAAMAFRYSAPADAVRGPMVTINGRTYGPFDDVSAGDIDSVFTYTCVAHVKRLSKLVPNVMLDSALRFDAMLEAEMHGMSGFFTGTRLQPLPVPKYSASTVLSWPRLSLSESLFRIDAVVCPFSATAARLAAVLLELGPTIVESRIVLISSPRYDTVPRARVLYSYRYAGTLGSVPVGTQVAVLPALPTVWHVEHASTHDLSQYTVGKNDSIDYSLVGLRLEGYGPMTPLFAGSDKCTAQTVLPMKSNGYFQFGPLACGFVNISTGEASVSVPVQDALGIRPLRLGLQTPSLPVSLPIDSTFHVITATICAEDERLALAMIASVLEQSTARIKLWLIGPLSLQMQSKLNALSTSPRMRSFSWQVVTYNWPSWLNSLPKYSSRLMAMKVLFLDVMMPAEVSRIVYLAPGQIVRGDITRLLTASLEGRPYGMVPICAGESASQSAASARFWEYGYWRVQLQGGMRAYHSTSVILADLASIRLWGVGDTLRAQYEAYSRDPMFLERVDQDLVNVVQSLVGIYSLAPEWHWSSAWCADGPAKDLALVLEADTPTKRSTPDTAAKVLPEWSRIDAYVSGIVKENTLDPTLQHQREL